MYAATSTNTHIRKAVIDKNNSLFYLIEINKNRLVILTFFDNRQDPQKFKL